jgi:hypothetical protein
MRPEARTTVPRRRIRDPPGQTEETPMDLLALALILLLAIGTAGLIRLCEKV